MKILIEKFGFDTSTAPPVYGLHVFSLGTDGLEHHIDGALRAQVPVPSVPEYLHSRNVNQLLTGYELALILSAVAPVVIAPEPTPEPTPEPEPKPEAVPEPEAVPLTE